MPVAVRLVCACVGGGVAEDEGGHAEEGEESPRHTRHHIEEALDIEDLRYVVALPLGEVLDSQGIPEPPWPLVALVF